PCPSWATAWRDICLLAAGPPLGYCFVTHAPPTLLYTLSLHDALPISLAAGNSTGESESEHDRGLSRRGGRLRGGKFGRGAAEARDRKSTRLNSSHGSISYAVFCLKKKTWPPSTPGRGARRDRSVSPAA